MSFSESFVLNTLTLDDLSIDGVDIDALYLDNTQVWAMLTPPSITAQPVASASIADDVSYTISVTATSNFPSTTMYQWYKNGSAISGATARTYTIVNQPIGQSTYYCRVYNAKGSVNSSNAVITSTLSKRDLAGVRLGFPSVISGAPRWYDSPNYAAYNRVSRSGTTYTSAEGLQLTIRAYYVGRTWIPATAYVAGYWADSALQLIRATPINAAGKYCAENGSNVSEQDLRTDRNPVTGHTDIYSTYITAFYKRA